MDANGNQRKRGGRLAKTANIIEPTTPKASPETNEVMEVSAVAISPTLEEVETSTTQTPASECRRSSRKKIIKFDVRDLLNKNRKTHKIQIEARIDSNAPSTSTKAHIVGANDGGNSKAASNVREDLLSKQKTFLEKSAIFRRYSISQEHKPPPPPLPMPPLLSKANDHKDTGFSGNSSSRRLSRTQEFFSNVMIKPKQTTSLIVAQIESSAPSSSAATAKRKSLNKTIEPEMKTLTATEGDSSTGGQLKKRGRPPKFKTQTSEEIANTTSVQEDEAKKKITPEKAKNWKEYKACLAQQSSSQPEEEIEEELKSLKPDEHSTPLKTKHVENLTGMLLNLEETQQSDISKSEDDDGSFFSGFKTSKEEDLSCDSPALVEYVEQEKLKLTCQAEAETKGKEATLKNKKSIKPETMTEIPIKTKIVAIKQVEKAQPTALTTGQDTTEKKDSKENTTLKETSLTEKSQLKSNIETEKPKANEENEMQKETCDVKQTSTSKPKEIIETLRQDVKPNDKTKAKDEEEDKPMESVNVKQNIKPKQHEILETLQQNDKINKDTMPSRRSTRKSPEIFEKNDTEMKSEAVTRRSQTKSPYVEQCATKDEEKYIEKPSENVKQTIATKPEEVIDSLQKDDKVKKDSLPSRRSTRKSPEIFEKTEKAELHIETIRSQVISPVNEKTAAKEEDAMHKKGDNVEIELKDEPQDHQEPETLDNTITKQTTRNTRSQLRKDDSKETPSNIQEIPDDKTNATTKMEENAAKISQNINKPTKQETPTTSGQSTEVKQLKSPQILTKTAQQLLDECTPQTELTAADILLLTSQTPQPSTTPSQDSMKTYSRTSSSSESENASERSSYSSDPSTSSSATSSSSGRSYKSGDKLRVSLKRISLPKSPSTSSQTSTSEELNAARQIPANVLKKKPPLAKRSKRLQKRFVELMESHQDDDDREDSKREHTTTVTEEDEESKAEENKAGDIESPLQTTKSAVVSENLQSNDSTNSSTEPVKEILVKRKSLRNRKDNESEEQDEDIDKSNTTESKPKEVEIKQKLQIKLTDIKHKETITQVLGNEKPKERELEKHEAGPSQLERTLEEDESNDSKQLRKTKTEQPTKKQPPRKLKKQTSQMEAEIVTDTIPQQDNHKEKLETEQNLEAKEEKLTKSSGKTNAGMKSKSITKELSRETTESTTERVATPTEKLEKQDVCIKTPTTRSKTNKQEINVNEKIKDEEITEIDDEKSCLKEIPKQSYSQQIAEQKETSGADKMETMEATDNKTDLTDKAASLREADKIPATRSNTYQEEISKSPAELKENSTQSSPKRNAQEKTELVSDIKAVQTLKITTDHTKTPKEILSLTDEQLLPEKPENSSKITATRSKSTKKDISTTKSNSQEENSTPNEKSKQTKLNQEIPLETDTKRSKSPKEKSSNSDEVSKILYTRSKSNKEQISLKESEISAKILIENPIQDETVVQQTLECEKERSKSPREKVTMTEAEEKSKKLTSNRKKNTKDDISNTKDYEMQEQPSTTAKERSKSPKEMMTTANEGKPEKTQDKISKIPPNRRKTLKASTTDEVVEEKSLETTKERSKSPKEKTDKTDDEKSKDTQQENTPKITTRRRNNNKEDTATTKEELIAEKSSEVAKDRSESPKEKTDKTDEEKSKDSQEKTSKITTTTRRRNNKEDISATKADIEPEKSSDRSQSPKEMTFKTDDEKSKDSQEKTPKIISTRRRNNKEDISAATKGEIFEEQSSESPKERSQSPKEKIIATSENSKQIAATRKKTNKEETSATKTKISEEKTTDELSLENKELENTIKSKNKSNLDKTESTIESSETPINAEEKSEDQEPKLEQIFTIRSKTNKEDTTLNTPTRSRSKKSNISTEKAAESPKPEISESENENAIVTSSMHAKPSKTSIATDTQDNKDFMLSENKLAQENLATKTSLDLISLPHADTSTISQNIEDVSQEIAIRQSSKSPTCSEVQQQSSSSAKRKSLRNQKDKNSPEVTPELTSDTPQILPESSLPKVPQEEETLPKESPPLEESLKVTKRKGRKSRFKNLYGPNIESETDSNNGKNTPIEEIMQQKLIEQTASTATEKQEVAIMVAKEVQLEIPEVFKESDKTPEIPANTEVQSEETVAIAKEPSSANLLSSQIQNVSIETNTLLDILRRVQSNTEAALKAGKANTVTNKTENDNNSESSTKVNLEESNVKQSQDLLEIPKESNPTIAILEDCPTRSQETKPLSPTRSDTQSPLSLKKIHLSPARSDSASPLTLKKIGQSPTRSDSSSPLTLKKVTRRYERRSRRGEDSDHKTLEETFAEIAAQSSKAVLAAKEFDINEAENLGEQLQLEINPLTNPENAQIEEIFTKIESSSSDAPVVTINIEEVVDKKEEETLQNLSQLPDEIEKIPDIIKPTDIDIKSNENVEVEVQESTKVTPARRGRKPKNRALEVSVTKEDIEVKSPTKSKDVNEEALKETEVHEEKPKEMPSEDNTENKMNKSKKPKSTCNLTTPDVNQTEESPESLKEKDAETLQTKTQLPPNETCDLSQANIESSLQRLEEVNESKAGKKSNKRRDTSKGETVAEDSTLPEVIPAKDKEDEVRTPKQPAKKRDTSQTKSESKSIGKKLPKKTKNEEEEDTFAKTVPSTVTTTPPPSKRGRKPKNQQQETPQTSSGSKKKTKKELNTDHGEELNEDKRKTIDSESESLNSSLDRSLDEKLAKKKRQKKLKEAFEAALTEDVEKSKEALKTETSSSPCTTNFGFTLLNNSPPPERRVSHDMRVEASKITCVTPVEAEEDPDPLKDIEKFIADGVNLLKKDYKLDEDSVDDVIPTTTTTTTTTTPLTITEIVEEPVKSNTEEIKPVFNTFETPADTPLNTPSVTPPPKSPTSIESSTTPDEISGVRRSHRIKLITKTPKALVGRGLVKDKERFSIKDDVETKSHYTLDDHLTGLAEVEAKNAKFLKEMEERLSNFQVIKENEYLCERVISREARKMICDCFLTHEEEERGELGCGEDCLNRLLMIECGTECNVKERCTNKRFQKLLCSPCRVFRTEKKGFGIMADIEILPGEFIMEYVGEVIDTDEFEKRRILYSQDKNRHYYFMALRSDAIIDATIKGNISRFINHSCDPNAETQKWTVNGELRIGFFSRKSIMPGEEITFNYQYQRYGREAQRCYCESSNCTGWIGQEPTSDEGEQIDDDDDDEYEESEEEEADTSNLLVQDDDEDSDASEADPEEVQKQLEMAAAQAEVELAPLQLLQEKAKQEEATVKEGEPSLESNKSEGEEDSKSKFKKLLSKMAEKVAAKQKQNKRELKLQRKKKSKESASADLSNKLRFLEDPDIEDEVEFLKDCGLKNQSDTLRLSRLMVRAKLVQTRLNLLEILRQGDLPCRRLFLDYHGLRLVHGWMSEDAGNMQIRLALLQTLDTLPIANKTVLTDSKVMQVVRNWCGQNTNLSPSEDSSSSNSNSQDVPVQTAANFEEGSDLAELQKLAVKLITTWDSLPEIFRIPKKERIEQMKEHEREADRQYAANAETQESTTNTAIDRYRRDRFGRGLYTPNTAPSSSGRFVKPNNGNPHRTSNTTPENNKNLSKAQRREMFAAKVARDEAEKRLAEERREFETKCRFFGLDPKKTRQQDIPFCVNPATGQWFSIERKPINTPPSYAHVQVPVKPKSTDPNDYQLPAVCSTLPPQWKYAITPQGKIYYYHIKNRIPQWEPPSAAQLQQCEMEAREDDSETELTTTAGEDSSDDDDDVLIGMDAAQLKAYIDRKVEMRRQKRYQRLVVERSISPRREEDRIYNQIEVRKYKENKEKIRKRKEEIRRKRAEALRQTSLNMCTLGSITDVNPNTNKTQTESPEEQGVLPIQDYLLSSDEESDLKVEVNSPLMDKIVEGDKIVDELDALTTKRQLKRPLPPHRDLNEPSTSSSSPASTSGLNVLIARQEYKKRKLEKKEKRKPKEQDAKYRKNKEKFRCEIAGIIVHHLKPYRKETCTVGRIQSNEDFNHLARKLTHFVMIKELKYCESVGQTLVVTESVKSKSREFIKKYMAKYTDVYVKPSNDPDFKDIPFTL